MTEKKGRSHIPPPPPPIASKPRTPLGIAKPPPPSTRTSRRVSESAIKPSASTAATTATTTPLTNGVTPGQGPGGDDKPKPPTKPFKLTRAFSSGSVTLPGFGKKAKRKSKILEAELLKDSVTTPTAKDDSEPAVRNWNGFIKENGNETTTDFKPQTITKPQKTLAKPSAIHVSDSSLVESEVPTNGLGSEVAGDFSSKGALENRELPPIPSDSDQDASRGWGNDVGGGGVGSALTNQIKDLPKRGGENRSHLTVGGGGGGGESGNSRESSPRGGGRRSVSPHPNTPPTSFDSNSSRKQFRPLPPTPQFSDEDDDMNLLPGSRDSPRRGSKVSDDASKLLDATADQTEASGNSIWEDEAFAKQEAELKEQSTNTSTSSLTPATQEPSTQESVEMTGEEVRSYTVGDIVTTYSYALPVRVRILQVRTPLC